MKLNIKNIFFSTLLIVCTCFIALSYNFETRALIEGTILSGVIDYPNEFNLYRVISVNAWSLPIQIISFFVKMDVSPFTISRIILLASTLMFFVGLFLITKFLLKCSLGYLKCIFLFYCIVDIYEQLWKRNSNLICQPHKSTFKLYMFNLEQI